jgi:aspartyl-tRNA(Asn)/glutamyl-tRNA(Gln) amidotransferase subunit A
MTMMTADRVTVSEAARAVRKGDLTCEGLLERSLAAIEQRAQELNAFVTITAESARAQARTADRELAAGIDRGPLHGMPVSLKDLIDVEGVATTAASRVREGQIATTDALIVDRLRQAGAVLVGKTNLHEFALGTTSEDSAFGPARHPLDPTRSPGGSSGGSAVSVATGMALASVGTDTGGSVRIPAAACGLVGLKPSSGEIPMDGVIPLSPSFDHVGPICRSVADARMMYDVLRGMPAAPQVGPAAPAGTRAAIPRGYFFDLLDTEVAELFAAACERLRRAGVVFADVQVANTDLIGPVYMHMSLPEAAAYHAPTLERMPERYTPSVRGRLEAGRYLLAEDYVRARRGCAVLREAVDLAMAACDVMLLPTLPIPAPLIGIPTVRVGERQLPVRNAMLRQTQLFNITGHPAIALPCGTTHHGLPASVQLVGRLNATAVLLEIAAAFEPHLLSRD